MRRPSRPSTRPADRPAVLVGRRHDPRQRHRDGRRGRGAHRQRLRLGADHPPLPGGLPQHTPFATKSTTKSWHVRRARSRVPVLARGSPDRHRQRRHVHHDARSTLAARRRRRCTSRRRRRACRSVGRQQHRTRRPGRRPSSGRVGEARSAARSTRTIGGQRYRFSTWNDSHKRVRDITVNSQQEPHGDVRPATPWTAARR